MARGIHGDLMGGEFLGPGFVISPPVAGGDISSFASQRQISFATQSLVVKRPVGDTAVRA